MHPSARVTLVSKDINLRIKAAIVGVHAEDYYSDKTIEDADLLYTGHRRAAGRLLGDARQEHASRGTKPVARSTSAQDQWSTDWHPNQFVYQDDAAMASKRIVRRIEGDSAALEVARDFRSERHSIWGITARNREQNFALNLLMDPEIDFVTILGPAGTGKTLLDAGRRARADARDRTASAKSS